MNQLLRKRNTELISKKKKGFTLVELIIVIAIIAILAAVAIPKFGDVRTNANAKADLATAKNIHTIVASEISDNKISLPAANQTAANAYALNAVGEVAAAVGTTPAKVAVDITTKIDGSTTPKTGTAFKVALMTNGDIAIYVDTTKVYPN
jgi:type IV pilus assembly protein PilA